MYLIRRFAARTVYPDVLLLKVRYNVLFNKGLLSTVRHWSGFPQHGMSFVRSTFKNVKWSARLSHYFVEKDGSGLSGDLQCAWFVRRSIRKV